jgi:hypothetical protein
MNLHPFSEEDAIRFNQSCIYPLTDVELNNILRPSIHDRQLLLEAVGQTIVCHNKVINDVINDERTSLTKGCKLWENILYGSPSNPFYQIGWSHESMEVRDAKKQHSRSWLYGVSKWYHGGSLSRLDGGHLCQCQSVNTNTARATKLGHGRLAKCFA